MKEQKRIKFNPKSGVALPLVMTLLFVLSLLGTAMYAYSMQSIHSVRYASKGKKAEYLAQAGVEAAAYAFQVAENNGSAAADFIAKSGEDGSIIESNRIWMVFDKSGSGTANGKKDYIYIASETRPENEDYDVIGYYEVTIENIVTNNVVIVTNYNADGTPIDDGSGTLNRKNIPTNRKLFKAVGVVDDVKRSKAAYMDAATTTKGLYYGNNGIIDGKYTDGNGNGASTTPKSQATKKFVQSGSYKSNTQLSWKFRWLNQIVEFFGGSFNQPDPVPLNNETVPFALCFSAGNLIIDPPVNDDGKNIDLTLASGQSNLVSFVAGGNVFLRSGLNVTSSDGYFNSVALRGKKIVTEGNIVMSAYVFNHNTNTGLFSGFSNNYSTLRALMNKKYRYSSVTIDAIDNEDYSDPDNLYTETPYVFSRSGKVYFGGDVFVVMTIPNVGTYHYKAFSSGDVYYFDAAVQKSYADNYKTVTGTQIENPDRTGGIDLFRYFLEYSIATKRYSNNVLNRFSDIIDFYYGNSTVAADANNNAIQVSSNGTAVGAYFMYKTNNTGTSTDSVIGTGDPDDIYYNAMRKVDKDKFGDSVFSLIPPLPSDASELHWGMPKEAESTVVTG